MRHALPFFAALCGTVTLVACDDTPLDALPGPDLWAVDAAPPPSGLSITSPVRGQDATVTVSLDATLDDVPVYVAVSSAGSGFDVGGCPPALAGDCIDLVQPLTSYGPSLTVDGVATFEVPIPGDIGASLWIQAAVFETSIGVLSEVVAATVSDAANVLTVSDAVPGGPCAHGGVSVTDGRGVTRFVCHGADGAPGLDGRDGLDGADGTSVTTVPEPVGPNCAHGGVAVNDASGTVYVCHGGDGADGADGASVTVATEPAGSNCEHGGAVIAHASGVVAYVCSAADVDVSSLEARLRMLEAELFSRTVFVTSARFEISDFGSAAGADALCQTAADAAGLEGTYMAWLSDTSTSPSARFDRSAYPYVRIDGARVADDWADLTDGTLQQPIEVDEYGDVATSASVWTATEADGALNAGFNCQNWSSTTPNLHEGNQSATDGRWTRGAGVSCGATRRLYCFQQD